jgi:preprotein translocase subunit SecG
MSSSLMTFVLVVHSLIAAGLVAVILLQRSEGGALGMGGGPGGLMTARGAGNFLTRATAILAALFLGTSIFLAILANLVARPESVDTSLAEQNPVQTAPVGSGPAQPADGGTLPMTLPGSAPAAPEPAAPAPASDDIPTAQ